VRRIIVILALGLLIYLIRRLQSRGKEPRPQSGPTPPDRPERLVRDRVCNTFLPPAAALCLDRDGVRHFFCSPTCRDKFLESADGNLTPRP
jgi:YHS domain-containing protein